MVRTHPGSPVPNFVRPEGEQKALIMSLAADPMNAQKPSLGRRLLRSRALREAKYRLLGSPLFRRLFTANFSSGLVALGERNNYAFPMHWITVDWSKADFSFWISPDSRLPFSDNSQRI